MTDLRSRLEGKTRRRCVVPVPVADPGPARQAYEAALVALATVAAAGGAAGAVEALQADVDAAQDALAACTVEVILQAPPAVDAEVLLSAHLDPAGNPDFDACLPELLELCAEDETLRDATWWRETLARPEWGRGDVLGLRLGVLYLVADPIRPLVPKG